MKFEVYRTSEPYNDTKTPQPCPGAELCTLANSNTVWCITINTLEELMGLLPICKTSIVLGRYPLDLDNTKYVDGFIEIYDDYRE